MISKETLRSILDSFSKYRIAVVGDAMLDHYLHGKVEKISAEAPIPVVEVSRETFALGGSANVAHNVVALGAECSLFGVTGRDSYGGELKKLLEQSNIPSHTLLEDSHRKTTHKMRILSGHYQIARVDTEDKKAISKFFEDAIVEMFDASSSSFDALIFEDYNKGVLTPSLITRLCTLCRERKILTAVDPKSENFFQFHQVDFFKPNRKELLSAMNKKVSSREELIELCIALQRQIQAKNILLTLSEDGMLLVDEKSRPIHVPAQTQEVFDPSGAGDSAISSFTLAYLSTKDLHTSMLISNLVASLSCRKMGVSTIEPGEILAAYPLGFTENAEVPLNGV